jgi:hypothetical protein
LKEVDKWEENIDFKELEYVNIGCELTLNYKEDEEMRSGGNQLKIYNQNNDSKNNSD